VSDSFSLVPVSKFKGEKTCLGGIGKKAAFRVAGTTLMGDSLLIITDRGPVGAIYKNESGNVWWSLTTPSAQVPDVEGDAVCATGLTAEDSARNLLHRQARVLSRAKG
jgi:hypothetical protein